LSLGMKFLQGMTATFQLPALGYGFTCAVENAASLAFGISPQGLKTQLPLDHATIARHEGSVLRWNAAAGGGQFELQAVCDSKAAPAGPVMQALTNVTAYAVRSNLDNLQVRHALPHLSHAAVTAITFVDLATQFIPAITQDDWAAAFDL